MNINPVAFYTLAVIAIGFSLLVVTKKNPVASAFSLVMVFFAFSGIYAVMNAHLIAALQILVYAGAIMVLFVFVIMLLNADAPSLDMKRTGPLAALITGVGVLVLLGVFVKVFKTSPQVATAGKHTLEAIEKAGGNTRAISQLMFSEFILPFELTSVLLLGGIIGAVALSKRKHGSNSTGGTNATS